jgi:hypothetical protein
MSQELSHMFPDNIDGPGVLPYGFFYTMDTPTSSCLQDSINHELTARISSDGQLGNQIGHTVLESGHIEHVVPSVSALPGPHMGYHHIYSLPNPSRNMINSHMNSRINNMMKIGNR